MLDGLAVDAQTLESAKNANANVKGRPYLLA